MKLNEYISTLNQCEKEAYASRCGTTVRYLITHIRYGRKEPRKELREALSRESLGAVSHEEVLEHFGLIAKERAA